MLHGREDVARRRDCDQEAWPGGVTLAGRRALGVAGRCGRGGVTVAGRRSLEGMGMVWRCGCGRRGLGVALTWRRGLGVAQRRDRGGVTMAERRGLGVAWALLGRSEEALGFVLLAEDTGWSDFIER